VSFVVSHPFEETSYPKDLRRLWKAIPDRAKDKIIEMGRKFGHHAMVEGAVPMTFDEGTDELIRPLLDHKYLQSIPEVYGGNPAKFWVDASVLNYSMLVDPQKSAKWIPVAIAGTASCVITNLGDGAAIDVDVSPVSDDLSMAVSGSTVWVDPQQGLYLTFTQDVPEGSELSVSWTSEKGKRFIRTVQLPEVRVPVASTKKPGLKVVA
jgi:hypothetical protein